MPEILENFAQNAHCQDFVDKEGPLPALGFYCDSTAEEDATPNLTAVHWAPADQAGAGEGAAEGAEPPCHFVRALDPTSTLTRGGQGDDSRGTIIPSPSLFPRPTNPSNSDFRTLVLRKMHRRTRGLLFDFTKLNLAVHLLTHTLVQIYSKEQWSLSICAVSKYRRGFKISFAIDLGKWVLAFTTTDGLTRPCWYKEIPPTTCILADRDAWLYKFIRWLTFVPNWCNSQAAIFDFLIGLKHIFNGLGIYTLNDILARAGLSPFWRPVEVFGNPSRTARLILSYAGYCLDAAEIARTCLDGCRFGYLIVQDTKRRIRYMRSTFVYGKSTATVSETVVDLIAHNEKRTNEIIQSLGPLARFHRGPANELYDIWTSDFVSSAATAYFTFDNLIYGLDPWSSKSPPRKSELQHMDPLTAFFASTLTLTAKSTHLHKDAKCPSSDRKKVKVHAFRLTTGISGKAISSLYTELHKASVSWDPLVYPWKDSHHATLLKEGENRTFNVTVASREDQITTSPIWIALHNEQYRLGPADYAGAADLIEHGAQKRFILCKGDPQANPADIRMYEHGLLVKAANRASDKADLRKDILASLNPDSMEAQHAKKVYLAAVKEYEVAEARRASSWEIVRERRAASAMLKPPPPKRQRMSIDAQMAQTAAANLNLGSGRSLRSKKSR